MNKYFLKTDETFSRVAANDASASIVKTTKALHYRCSACSSCGLNGDSIIYGFLLTTKLSKDELRNIGVFVSSLKAITIIQ